jgi:hypothetical protein
VRALALIGLACGVGVSVHPSCAQVTANVEAGVSDIQYDGFLASAAASISPSMRWEHPRGRGFVSARGTYLRFESGRRSLDGSANASWFAPLSPHWRGELGVTAGASDYANIASFSHGQADARLHLMDQDRGGWIAATIGRSSFGSGPRPVTVVAVGAWLLRADKTLFVSLDRSFIGDTAYTDLRSSARWRGARIVLEGIVGARVWSRGGGRGVFGEGSATVTLGRQAALVLSAGRYPTDAVSGSIAGRYVTGAVRLGTISVRRPATPTFSTTTRLNASHSSTSSTDTRLEIQARQGDDVRLTLYAPGATAVEISGDFTDWRPVPLSPNPENADAWGATFRISRGMHRINVRRDGGPWMAPGGTTRSADDYDGEVGVFVVP